MRRDQVNTPPRSDDVIRDKLAAIASAPTSESQGSLVNREGHRILVGTFHSLLHCRRFQADIQRENIPSNRMTKRGKYEVWVDEEDCSAAAKYLAEFRESNPDLPSPNRRRRFDATIFLAAIFGGLAFAFAFTGKSKEAIFWVPFRFVILGAVVGQLIDRLRQKESSRILLTFLIVTVFAVLIRIVMTSYGFLNAPA